jgi:hypothetical protein
VSMALARSGQRQTMALLHWNRSTGLGAAATKTSAREARVEAELLCSGGVVDEEQAAVDELPSGTETGTRRRGWSRNWSGAALFPRSGTRPLPALPFSTPPARAERSIDSEASRGFRLRCGPPWALGEVLLAL